MRVQFSVTGFVEEPTWESDRVDLDVLPRVGEVVEVPGLPDGQVHCRTVVHYPWASKGPFVYIVLGPPRR